MNIKNCTIFHCATCESGTFHCVQFRLLAPLQSDFYIQFNRIQARIQDFAQGGATAKRGPEARGPQVLPIKNQKVCGFGPLFFSWGRLPFYCLIFLFNFVLHILPLRVGPRPPCLPAFGYVLDRIFFHNSMGSEKEPLQNTFTNITSKLQSFQYPYMHPFNPYGVVF